MRRLASVLLVTVGALIGLGAFGHSFMGRLAVDAELGKFPVDPNVGTMLYVVWYFVGCCMALFGGIILWAWVRLRTGDPALLPITALIGLLYFAIGAGGFIFRRGDPFMLVFLVQGATLASASLYLNRDSGPPQTVRRRTAA
jgi:hypothetical protein